MTHEEVKAAIERLRKISYGARKYNALEAVEAVIPDGSWVDGLTDLLQQADPRTHMEVPVDADGVPIHIGEELCGYGYPNGGVRCYAIVNERTILVQGDPSAYKDWLLWDAANCRHYHAPTMKDVLRDFLSASEDAMRKGYDEVPDEIYAEYAERLREVMADDDE